LELNVIAKKVSFVLAGMLLVGAAALSAQNSPSGKASTDSSVPSDACEGTVGEGTVEVLNSVPKQEEGTLCKEYVPLIVKKTTQSWWSMIPMEARPPESRKGRATIEFTIQPDGKITDMKLVKQSGDDALDYAAWMAIKNAQPYSSFDKLLTVPYLKLRFIFLCNEKPESERQSEEAKPPQTIRF
jgi:TonB family protein